MGRYTGLRCKVIIKEEYRKDINKLINDDTVDEWGLLENDIFKEFDKIDRSSFIPFGCLSYMPDEWEESTGLKDKYGYEITKDTDGFDRKFNTKTGLLTFQCSLKNYKSTIEYFLENVLTKICEKSYHIEYLYEEDSVSTLYKIENEKLIELDKGIRYNDYDLDCCPFTGETSYNNENFYQYYDYDFTYEGKC